MVSLWDWPQEYLYIFTASAMLIVPVGVGFMANSKLSGDGFQLLRFAGRVNHEAAEFWRWLLFGFVLMNWLLMMVAIISYRENLFGVALIFSPVVDAASVLFPPIQDIPKVMRSKGFGERGTIIQVVASIGINAALATAGVVGYLRANGLTRLNKEASSVSSSWLSIASIATVGFAYSCTWFLFWPSNNYNQKGAIMFDGFTTSDLSLLFRFWFWPTAIFVLAAMALATVVRRIRFGRYDEYNKYKEG